MKIYFAVSIINSYQNLNSETLFMQKTLFYERIITKYLRLYCNCIFKYI